MSDATDIVPDAMSRPDDDALPAWVARELRRPVATDPAARQRIMARVRAAAPATATAYQLRARHGWRARRGLAPLAGLATAAAFSGLIALGAARSGLVGTEGVGAVLRDTINGAVAARGTLTAVVAADPSAVAAGDSPGSALLRDTLRLVRFVLVAPTATRLALVGDFNGWNERATPMLAVAESTGMWEARVALRPGAHRYAFVQDDSQWVAGAGVGRVVLP